MPIHNPIPWDAGTEYEGTMGPAGVPKYRPPRHMRANDRARLLRLTGTTNPRAPISTRVWNGEDILPTSRQILAAEEEFFLENFPLNQEEIGP
jgi:hypothetical protein